MTCVSSMGRGCYGPLPAGMGGPVSSAFWCEFHLSGDSVKVPVRPGKHVSTMKHCPAYKYKCIHTVCALFIVLFVVQTVENGCICARIS